MDADRVIRLLLGYLSGNLNNREELDEWLAEESENREFFESVASGRHLLRYARLREKIDTKKAIRKFDRRTGRVGFVRRWVSVAAAVVVLVAGGTFFALHRLEQPLEVVETVLPGSDQAVLILADGTRVDLAREDSLQLTLAEGCRLVNRDSRLEYRGEHAGRLQYNELQVPRGSEYRIRLADGSTIHLNSASSLKYPVVFGSDRRVVRLSGEAWFEVAKSDVPFYVQVGELTIRVYGTSFNVNSHAENHIRTALVSGKVGIAAGGREFMMAPSQLADFDTRTRRMEIRETDLTPYLAWRQGMFVFEKETLGQIMATLSLWYDMEVFFRNPELKELHFTGSVKRYESVDNLLKALSQSVGVRFSVRGKVVTISYK